MAVGEDRTARFTVRIVNEGMSDQCYVVYSLSFEFHLRYHGPECGF